MRTWKLKVGGAEPAEEGRRVGSLLQSCIALGLRLRLDANQAWDCNQAATFCQALRATTTPQETGQSHQGGHSHHGSAPLSPPGLEFCEEPLQPSLCTSLPALYRTYGFKYALDESVLPAAAELRALRASASAADAAGSGGAAGVGGAGHFARNAHGRQDELQRYRWGGGGAVGRGRGALYRGAVKDLW